MNFFDRAFDLIVGSEGGYVNDPRDPGGETKFGISKKSYPSLDIANLTLDQAKSIYLANYWNPCRCGEMPWKWALPLFDAAVNQGVGTAKRELQDALGVMVDGNLGPATMNAIVSSTDRHVARFLAKRAVYYAGLPTFPTYGFGWLTRLFVRAFDVMREPVE